MEEKPGYQRKKNINQIYSAQIKFLRSVKCCSVLDEIKKINKSVAYSSQGSHTDQLAFWN
jgi:hypothetical protein